MRRAVPLFALAAAAAVVVATTPPAVGAIAAVVTVLAGGLVARRGSARGPRDATALGTDRDARGRPSGEGVEAETGGVADRRAWIESVPCGLVLLGDDLTVLAANQAALALAGRLRSQVEGVSLIRAFRDHNLAQVAHEAAGVPREIDAGDGQVTRVTATRGDRAIGGVRVIVALEDLSELRRAQRARSDLVANASHELRTPVAAALALAETLEMGVDDEATREDFHRRLTGEITRLGGIVEGLLKLSRLETGRDEFAVEALEPGELLNVAARRIEPLLTDGRSLALVDEAHLPAVGDRERTLEVLSNLLDNALRVSPVGGTVTLGAFAGEDEVRFEVRDEGPGITPRDRARVFERFYTGEESRSDIDSSGLGLAIARHIVTNLGGRIWVADRTPGATVCFTLPAGGRDGIEQAAASTGS